MRGRLSRIAALRASVDGYAARRDGTPLTGCPYDVDGEPYERFLARYWARGWNAAKPT